MPEDPLQDWHEWNLPINRKPVLRRQLNTGRTNKTYLIEIDKTLGVLRINASNSGVLGIDRQRELNILESASAAGLAPEILYCSTDHGVMISEFIDGQHWQACVLDTPEKLSLLLETLHRIHTLKVSTSTFNYQQHELNYWRQLENGNISIPDDLCKQREKLLPLLARIPASNVICHHDPNPQNIVVHAGRLYFLDWEYAAPGWPAFDYAALSVEWNIPVDKLVLRNGLDIDEIKEAIDLYVYLCDLWSYLQKSRK